MLKLIHLNINIEKIFKLLIFILLLILMMKNTVSYWALFLTFLINWFNFETSSPLAVQAGPEPLVSLLPPLLK